MDGIKESRIIWDCTIENWVNKGKIKIDHQKKRFLGAKILRIENKGKSHKVEGKWLI